MALIGPLLAEALAGFEQQPAHLGFLAVASGAVSGGGTLQYAQTADRVLGTVARAPAEVAVTALVPRRPPRTGEPWKGYRDETLKRLERAGKRLRKMGVEPQPLVAATALQFRAAPDQLRYLEDADPGLELVELDPPLLATALDDVPSDIGLPTFQQHNSGIDGSKVTVAVLDTGIDTDHPYLEVAESSNTSGEPIERPGVHGTHCAGIIASRDQDFRGVAPGVRLLNVKVGRANGYVEPGNLSRGFDTLSDTGFAIISVSLGFNHRPITSTEGHGWQCGRYRCVVCRAVDTSVRRGHLVVVAAGNEHERADALRRTGEGKSFDTELCCPGQTTAAVTVGSVSKRDGLPASTSSRGPSARGAAKPDIAAPGVNITSTIPIPRDADNAPERNAARRDLFARDSGTSMATPVVAGAAALLAQRMIERGREPTPAALKSALVRSATRLPFGHDAVGAGRVQMP